MDRSSLRRRRYDWNWHATALHAALRTLPEHLPLNVPFFALVPELEAPFLTAVLSAAAGAGFELDGLALRTRHDPAQILWHRRAFSHENREASEAEIDPQVVSAALHHLLEERGEPTPYLHLHAAALVELAAGHALNWRDESVSDWHAPIQECLAAADFVHYAESQNPESGLWGISRQDPEIEPLADRVEVAIVRSLQKNPDLTFRDLEAVINPEFPSLLTPPLGLLRAVLASYAGESDGIWHLRSEDTPAARLGDLDSAVGALAALAVRLDFSSQRLEGSQRILQWLDGREIAYTFFLLASAVVGRILRAEAPPAGKRILVLPGGRASLLAYKLERDAGLKSAAEGWQVVKFRHLRRLVELTALDRPRWEKELAGDPLEPPEQMKLF